MLNSLRVVYSILFNIVQNMISSFKNQYRHRHTRYLILDVEVYSLICSKQRHLTNIATYIKANL